MLNMKKSCRRARSIIICLCLTLILPGISTAQPLHAPTDIYFVRHGETMGNLTHHHNHKNDRTLSPEGNRQVAALTHKLDQLHFDHIIVSPKYRVLKTILPYLKKHHLVAEIWPELEECCWQKNHDSPSEVPARGSPIRLDADMKHYFTFTDTDSRFRFNTRGYGQGMMQTFMATEKIKRRFSTFGQRILIVGHYHSGSRIIEILQGIEPVGRYKISNTQILHLRERSDGTFSLVKSNMGSN